MVLGMTEESGPVSGSQCHRDIRQLKSVWILSPFSLSAPHYSRSLKNLAPFWADRHSPDQTFTEKKKDRKKERKKERKEVRKKKERKIINEEEEERKKCRRKIDLCTVICCR